MVEVEVMDGSEVMVEVQHTPVSSVQQSQAEQLLKLLPGPVL